MGNTVRESFNRRWSHAKNKLSLEAPKTSPTESTSPLARDASLDATWPTPEYRLANPLLDLELLKVPARDHTWFRAVNAAVRDMMNGPPYDAAHDYQHARRIVANGKTILEHEAKHHEWARKLDPMVIYLGCLVYSIGNPKFCAIGEDREQDEIVDVFLQQHDCPKLLRRQIAYLVCRVSTTLQVDAELEAAHFADEYPAFKIIQDAIWLDRLGRVGVARMFSGSLDEEYSQKDNLGWMIESQLSRLPGKMKTKTGKKIAGERHHWMVSNFLVGYKEETEDLGV